MNPNVITEPIVGTVGNAVTVSADLAAARGSFFVGLVALLAGIVAFSIAIFRKAEADTLFLIAFFGVVALTISPIVALFGYQDSAKAATEQAVLQLGGTGVDWGNSGEVPVVDVKPVLIVGKDWTQYVVNVSADGVTVTQISERPTVGGSGVVPQPNELVK